MALGFGPYTGSPGLLLGRHGYPSGIVVLNSAYVPNVSGAVVRLMFYSPIAGNITDFYLCKSTHAGTLANIQGTLELKDATGTSGPWISGPTLATKNFGVPSANDRAFRVTLTSPVAVSLLQPLTVLVYNTSSSPGVDYWAMPSSTSSPGLPFAGQHFSTNGLSSGASGDSQGACAFAVRYNTGEIFGSMLAGRGFPQKGANSSNYSYFATVIQPCSVERRIVGFWLWRSGYSHVGLLKLATNPTISPGPGEVVYTLPSRLGGAGNLYFPTPIVLAPNQGYRFFLRAETAPSIVNETGYTANISDTPELSVVTNQNLYYASQSNSANTAWNDGPDYQPFIFPIFADGNDPPSGAAAVDPLWGGLIR